MNPLNRRKVTRPWRVQICRAGTWWTARTFATEAAALDYAAPLIGGIGAQLFREGVRVQDRTNHDAVTYLKPVTLP